MDKMQKNIDKILAIKALKKIRHIVDNEETTEKDEGLAAKLIGGLIVVVFVVLFALISLAS